MLKSKSVNVVKLEKLLVTKFITFLTILVV
jgi:hypothetical protein